MSALNLTMVSPLAVYLDEMSDSKLAPRPATLDGKSEIQEIKVLGGWAFMWTKLSVTATPPDGSPPMERAGHTLTVLRKEQDMWVIARDANLLAPVQHQKS